LLSAFISDYYGEFERCTVTVVRDTKLHANVARYLKRVRSRTFISSESLLHQRDEETRNNKAIDRVYDREGKFLSNAH
jgi:hypothetical protein